MRSWAVAFTLLALGWVSGARAQTLLTFNYTPAPRAQLAIWIEDGQGKFLATVALTEATAFRGIGNRPGASLMNSGYRFPYGRREGVLPIWAHRRASAPGAQLFPRIIFQDRGEGLASQKLPDQSVDHYYCLQFDMKKATRDELDAVSCATVFNSDKGRYMTDADLAKGYFEPWQDPVPGSTATVPPLVVDSHKPLPLKSLYPPRMDATRCSDLGTCFDHTDVDRFASDVRAVMPEIDAITLATPPGDVAQKLLFNVPREWAPGKYSAYVEVGLEGDYNAAWNDKVFPGPTAPFPTPNSPPSEWDTYSVFYGYPYRGQPSLVWKVDFELGGGETEQQFVTDMPMGRSSWNVWGADYGKPAPVDVVAGDPEAISLDQPASGVDRLRRDAEGHRVIVESRDTEADPPYGPDGPGAAPVGPIEDLRLSLHPNRLRSHTWIMMHLLAADSMLPLHAYEVRVSTEPITDEASFIRDGRQAKTATDDREGATSLMLPITLTPGTPIEIAVGDLIASTHYYVGVRAIDEANRAGPLSVAEITTDERRFATVSPCFIATAAYGSPLAQEVSVLRRVRDRYLAPIAPGRAAVRGYYASSEPIAAIIAEHPQLRAAVRAWLDPVIRLARLLL